MAIKKHIAIIGGGPSAMMLASCIDTHKYKVSLYEKNAALGRKFLVAGKGGFNLTHSELKEQFVSRYHPRSFIKPFLEQFSNTDFRNWLSGLGIETYVGTSKRVFPVKGIKPIEVLKAIEKKMLSNKVDIYYQHIWNGWQQEDLCFRHGNEDVLVKADILVFALGGASWKITGSDGSWSSFFEQRNIVTLPFEASNCACEVNWDKQFIDRYEGQALKNSVFNCGTASKKGEVVITRFGIEGSGLYPLSGEIRKQLAANGKALLNLDLKPDLEKEDILERLNNRGNFSVKQVLEKKLNLTELQIELLKSLTSKDTYTNMGDLCTKLKALPVAITGLAPLDEAISSVGGISLDEVTEHLELKKLAGHFCLGEMLNWDAPTGGYLLQACFSMGYAVANYLNKQEA